MYLRLTIFLYFIAIPFCNAQLMDSIARSFEEKPSLYFNYGSQYSFISNKLATISNVKIGVDYSGTFKLGLGFNWLSKKYKERNRFLEADMRLSQLHMYYFSAFAEYTFFKTYHWEATIPAQIGCGWANYSYSNSSNANVHSANKLFVLYEPMMTIQYRFLKYFGIGCGIGYRLVVINRTVIEEQMTSPLFVLKSKLFVGDLWRDITKK